jgi:hypothetical protein
MARPGESSVTHRDQCNSRRIATPENACANVELAIAAGRRCRDCRSYRVQEDLSCFCKMRASKIRSFAPATTNGTPRSLSAKQLMNLCSHRILMFAATEGCQVCVDLSTIIGIRQASRWDVALRPKTSGRKRLAQFLPDSSLADELAEGKESLNR